MSAAGNAHLRAARPFVLFVAAVAVVIGVSIAVLVTHRPQDTSLSTTSADPDGTRALATLLRDQGVRVEETSRPDDAVERAGADTTLVVASTTFLTRAAARSIADRAGTVVVLQPDPSRLADLAPQVTPGGPAGDTTPAPGCDLHAAIRAGRADVGSAQTYKPAHDAAAVACYPDDGGYSLVQVGSGTRTVTVVGSTFPFVNGGLDHEGNAALAMNLLGGHHSLVWLLPDEQAASGVQTGSLGDLVPLPVRVAAFGAVLALALFGFARGRRLGPVLAERLPVIVRATETTEGRSRLYRSLRARERAVEALRGGVVARLRTLVRLPRDADPPAVVAAVAGRTGRDPVEVERMLYGEAPADDAALVRLADELDALEKEVRRS
ncbi:MAG TPA: DUF4350 domain-containing protein [Streptosporangiales bacterium]